MTRQDPQRRNRQRGPRGTRRNRGDRQHPPQPGMARQCLRRGAARRHGRGDGDHRARAGAPGPPAAVRSDGTHTTRNHHAETQAIPSGHRTWWRKMEWGAQQHRRPRLVPWLRWLGPIGLIAVSVIVLAPSAAAAQPAGDPDAGRRHAKHSHPPSDGGDTDGRRPVGSPSSFRPLLCPRGTRDGTGDRRVPRSSARPPVRARDRGRRWDRVELLALSGCGDPGRRGRARAVPAQARGVGRTPSGCHWSRSSRACRYCSRDSSPAA